MDYNIKVEVALVVVAAGISGNIKVLLSDNKLPSVFLSNQSIKDTIRSLLTTTINIDPRWVRLIQGDIVDKLVDSNQIILPVGCMIPEEVSIDSGIQWENISSILMDKKIDKSYLEAIENICKKL